MPLPPVVSIHWAEAHKGDVVLADVRWYLDGRSGQAAYEAGHLPGAVFVDLEGWLSAEKGTQGTGGGRHPLPDPRVFAAGMASSGVGDESPVVAYDDQGGVIAARLVWMLRATGHDAALLDGGLLAYEGPLETAYPVIRRARFSVRPWPPALLADIEEASDPANVVIDARNRDRFHGENESVDPRAGHIPGAVSLPCRENIDEKGMFLPVAELRRRFEQAGAGTGRGVVCYCGSGVTACHNLLALELCGLGPGRLYPGSWSEYSATERPVET